MAGRERSAVACVLLSPWPLEQVRRHHAGVPVAILNEARRVTQVCPLARAAGVQVGLRETAALGRCPELQVEVVPAPQAQAGWAALLEQLYARATATAWMGRRPASLLWEAHRALLCDAQALIVQGQVTRQGRAVTLRVDRLADLRLPRGGEAQAAD
ncbi:hypothetical protein [Deinococcus hohokamensis]|uniref:UmuC domain-containing protein n=1 Tax=Deinococcus hohokamensis TaxID=309883 RepID=A0ABV9I7X3_9DEIO